MFVDPLSGHLCEWDGICFALCLKFVDFVSFNKICHKFEFWFVFVCNTHHQHGLFVVKIGKQDRNNELTTNHFVCNKSVSTVQ